MFACSHRFLHTWVVTLRNDDSMVRLTKEDVSLDATCCNKKSSVFLMILLCDDLEWGFPRDTAGAKNSPRTLSMNSSNSKWLVLHNEQSFFPFLALSGEGWHALCACKGRSHAWLALEAHVMLALASSYTRSRLALYSLAPRAILAFHAIYSLFPNTFLRSPQDKKWPVPKVIKKFGKFEIFL